MGGSAPCLRSEYRWIERFKTSVELFEDIHRIGRPQTGYSQLNITRVHKLIEENTRISLSHLQEKTSLCRGTLIDIIQLYLKMRKLSSRWIHHDLTPAQKLTLIAPNP